MTIAERFIQLTDDIRDYANKAGRDPASIHIVAVSKRHPVSLVQEAVSCGIQVFGENRVQEAVTKASECAHLDLEWHMIGHLQRNKVKQAARVFHTIHSLDSIALADQLNDELGKQKRTMRAFIQVKLSPEMTKTGLDEDAIEALVTHVYRLPNLNLVGLMGMPPFTEDAEASAPYFHRLRQLQESLNAGTCRENPLTHLSMGMSHDFRVAIREGATYIRIGTLLFGERNYVGI